MIRVVSECQEASFSGFTHFAGFDWASDHHNVVIVDRSGKIVADFQFSHCPDGWTQFAQRVLPFTKLALCIETSHGSAIEQLLCVENVAIYPIHAKNANRYRDRKVSSGNKTDRLDAWALADALRLDGHRWLVLKPTDPLTEEIRLLCRDEVNLIALRTQLVNKLKAALSLYYPAALQAFDDWTRPVTWRFLKKFPTAQTLSKASKREHEKFLHANKLFRSQTYAKRLEIFANANKFAVSKAVESAKRQQALSLAELLATLDKQLQAYTANITALFQSHPSAKLFASIPAAATKLAPRLLAEILSAKSRVTNLQGLQCFAGTAPVSFQSGQIHKVRIRHHCNTYLRSYLHLWADIARRKSPWMAAFYSQLKIERRKTHAMALRVIANRFLKILWKMLITQKTYDESFHQLSLKNQNSPLAKSLSLQPTPTSPSTC